MSIFSKMKRESGFLCGQGADLVERDRRQGGGCGRADLGAANEESAEWRLSFCGGGRGPMR